MAIIQLFSINEIKKSGDKICWILSNFSSVNDFQIDFQKKYFDLKEWKKKPPRKAMSLVLSACQKKFENTKISPI
ncbi:hypothetical protein [Enterococcus larvae]|uniref:hypothetical protein n=1 Tax=Enterococcus larvae TaxID=2794352 RepID=UPI003F2D57AC